MKTKKMKQIEQYKKIRKTNDFLKNAEKIKEYHDVLSAKLVIAERNNSFINTISKIFPFDNEEEENNALNEDFIFLSKNFAFKTDVFDMENPILFVEKYNLKNEFKRFNKKFPLKTNSYDFLFFVARDNHCSEKVLKTLKETTINTDYLVKISKVFSIELEQEKENKNKCFLNFYYYTKNKSNYSKTFN